MTAVGKVGKSLGFFVFKRMYSNRVRSVSYQSDSTTDTDTSAEHYDSISRIQEFIPKLIANLHKGECGRIGVIGGSVEYTGAPYFAAISSLKLGADLAYVFCCREAAPVIKSYSPELIVHPILDSPDAVNMIEPLLGRLHALVIGPGLGRDAGLLKNVGDIITHCKEKLKPSIPLIIDADGLFLITEDLSLIENYNGPLILTPNAVEYNRLNLKLSLADPFDVAKSLNVLLVQKGLRDIITNGIHNKVFNFSQTEATSICDVPGSNRRCGGQGDILSGCLATFIAWLQLHLKKSHFDYNMGEMKRNKLEWYRQQFQNYSVAAYGACLITKTSSRLAFEQFGRGMTATDMIPFIYKAFRLHFGQ